MEENPAITSGLGYSVENGKREDQGFPLRNFSLTVITF
jgi:hypothetical protein